jgi:hypothetical protein
LRIHPIVKVLIKRCVILASECCYCDFLKDFLKIAHYVHVGLTVPATACPSVLRGRDRRLLARRRIDISKPTEPPAGAAGAQLLFDTRPSDLLSRTIHKKVFQNERPFPAIQWSATAITLDLAVGRRVPQRNVHAGDRPAWFAETRFEIPLNSNEDQPAMLSYLGSGLY